MKNLPRLFEGLSQHSESTLYFFIPRFKLPRRTNRILTEKKEPTDTDPTWYNLYSDGWCEQGGIATLSQLTVALHLNYEDTNYNVLLTPYTNGATYFEITSLSNSGFTWSYHRVNTSVIINGIYWRACGYTSTTTSQCLEIYLN